MLETAYEPCQPNGWYDTDDYHDWVAQTFNAQWAEATAAHYTLCVQGHWNPLVGERIPDHLWDLYHWDQAWAR